MTSVETIKQYSGTPVGITEKRCPRCKTIKSVSQYYRHSNLKTHRDGLQGYCKQCSCEAHVLHAKKYVEANRKRAQRYYWSHRTAIRAKVRGGGLGLTPEQIDSLFKEQNSCCAICKTTTPNSKRGWFIDHDHVTNKFRGILCPVCNIGLGMFKDNIDNLLSAAKYLERAS